MLSRSQARSRPKCGCGKPTSNAGGVCTKCIAGMDRRKGVRQLSPTSVAYGQARVCRVPTAGVQICGGGVRRIYNKLEED